MPDLVAVDAAIERHYAGKKAADYRGSHRALARFAMKTNPRHVEQTTSLVGRPPHSHA